MTFTESPTSRLEAVLDGRLDAEHLLSAGGAVSRRERVLALLSIYDLTLAPLHTIGDRARLAGHPGVAAVKQRLETDWLTELDTDPIPAGLDNLDAATAMRRLATHGRLPAAYRWLATHASWPELVRFLALEGGPDGGFDDLVALCQVGLTGTAKLELGHNYWDELGNGTLTDIHTTLHENMATAIDMPRLPYPQQPTEGLERIALGGLLATNRWLQPEMIGALGMTELQAGPRCRLVLQAFDRLGAPPAAYPFYEVHAEVDPKHGKDWVELAVAPLATEHPDWGPRMLRGAWWRLRSNDALFTRLHEDLAGPADVAA